jgi:hypothetical protein
MEGNLQLVLMEGLSQLFKILLAAGIEVLGAKIDFGMDSVFDRKVNTF